MTFPPFCLFSNLAASSFKTHYVAPLLKKLLTHSRVGFNVSRKSVEEGTEETTSKYFSVVKALRIGNMNI